MQGSTETPQDFLSFSSKFKLGCLLTEQQNPSTVGLSSLATDHLDEAIARLKQMDVDTIDILAGKIGQLQGMHNKINEVLETGGRIFICGCGATGRLSIVLETLWRQEAQELLPEWADRVISFMAGGDAALIKSIEDFQDHPQFAEQQLRELGFTTDDLLIGSTEGGETSWVIGAVWEATKLSKHKPFILYGNTDQILVENVERSRLFIQSDKIIKINCNVGYMALAGSTRMQSTTILMYGIGIALIGCDRFRLLKHPHQQWRPYAVEHVDTFRSYLKKVDLSLLSKLIVHETDIYKHDQHVSYQSEPYYAVTILTDTTERSPTFSLPPFPNIYQQQLKESWCNLNILHVSKEPLTSDNCVEQDWKAMLGRDIRGLNSPYWQAYKAKVPNNIILGFVLHEPQHDHVIKVERTFKFIASHKDQELFQIAFPEYPSNCRLAHHSFMKILLNTHSTLVMGRMNRYESNIMTYVKPTNYKLIDRAARYVMLLRKGTAYDEAVRAIYSIRQKIEVDEPIVLKVIEYLNDACK